MLLFITGHRFSPDEANLRCFSLIPFGRCLTKTAVLAESWRTRRLLVGGGVRGGSVARGAEMRYRRVQYLQASMGFSFSSSVGVLMTI
jgi:hypothetical protein